MACLAWLPLNGDLKNQGIGNISLIKDGVGFGTGLGKVSNTYMNSGALIIKIPEMSDTKQLTFMFWAYVDSSLITDNWTLIARMDDQGTNAGSSMRIEVCPKGNYNGIYCFSNHNNPNFGLTYGCITSKQGGYYDQWVHFCFTSDGTTFRRYMNGVDIGNCEYSGKATFNGVFLLANSSKIYKQDCRIYDTCLSAKEIKEISKGLCCHYPLNDNFVTSSVNLYDKPYCDGSPSYYTGYTLTKNKDGEGYNFNIEFSGNGNDTWFWIQYPQFSFTDGEMYDYSCKIRINTLNFSLYLRAARNSNDWETPSVVTINKTTDGKWIELHTQITIHSSYTFNGTTITANPLLEFCTSPLNSNGFNYAADFDIKDVQVVPISENMSVPFSPKEFRSNVLYDTSGFGNNGYFHDESSGVEFAPNSPRYDGCYKFLSKHYLIGNSPWREDTYLSEFTLSFWLNQEDGSGGYSTFFNSWGYGSDGLWLGMNVEGKGAWAFRNVSPNYATTTPFVCTHNEWYHFVYVFINGNVGWYVNGNAQTWTKYNDTTMHILDYFILGDNYSGTTWDTTFIGKISDFRWYATALTAEDIKELYNTPITITNNGTLLTQGEFKEEE